MLNKSIPCILTANDSVVDNINRTSCCNVANINPNDAFFFNVCDTSSK